MADFNELREKYPVFEYRGFDVERDMQKCHITFHFAIPGLSEFDPEWEFPVTVGEEEIDEALLNRLVFQLGMVETISYYKSVCPPIVRVCCGRLDGEQTLWWRKLYYNGLGEFMYRNGIRVTKEELVRILCTCGQETREKDPESSGRNKNPESGDQNKIDCESQSENPLTKAWNFPEGTDCTERMHDVRAYEGCLVPVGGGKDSVVSLELLKQKGITTYSINGNTTTRNVIDVCREKKGDYRVKRTLDPRMLELNKQGYLNGHIPFSAVVAFSAVIAAYLSGNRYIVLSNETSANESTVKDSFVNHQYSKSFEFEQDFDRYIRTLTDSDIHYFSFLRPLTELQIAWLFAGCRQYHAVFRSCNAGSKQGIWCCNCPKCLFVYIILSPFLNTDELVGIFGKNLLDQDALDLDFRELLGIEENKPFECVGTRREVVSCMRDFVEKGGHSLLTDRYRDFILRCDDRLDDSGKIPKVGEILKEWEPENHLPEEFAHILKSRIKRLQGIAGELDGKRILIWGYGREGKSTEGFLKRECPSAVIEVFEGKREEIEDDRYDLIIKSPGIVMFEENEKFTSQTELFLKEFRDQTIGVTGTKGKSTTSSMLYQVLSDCTDKKVILLGNIGKPCLDYYEEIDEDTIIVFEMSCHQLMHTKVSPHVAVFLNLYEEHLDYYGTVERYFEAKSHIAAYQKEGDYAFLGENVPPIDTKAEKTMIARDNIYQCGLKALGEHNLYNARFVREIAVGLYGCDEEKVRQSLEGFEALPHRLKYIGDFGGVSYYDDSISTIPEAAIQAVESIPGIQTILVGGMDRGINYDILIDFIQKRKDIRFICMYASGRRIYEAVCGAGEKAAEIRLYAGNPERVEGNCYFAEDLEQAVELARGITDPGRACALSPAAASYGYFKNFEERGDRFMELVSGNK